MAKQKDRKKKMGNERIEYEEGKNRNGVVPSTIFSEGETARL